MQRLESYVDDEYGRQIRERFKDIRGSSELAMLATPSGEEFGQLKLAVAIMTPSEKKNAGNLSDKQIQGIADDARIDAGVFAIFINGYILENKRVS